MNKFDVVFTNPPYNDGADLKLLKVLIDNSVAKEIVCIHPATFLFNHNGTKSIEDLKNTNTLEEVTFFWGNKIFEDTEVKNAHCISIWNMNHNSDKVTIHDKAFTERKDVYDVDEFTYTNNVNDITVHSKVADKATALMKKWINCDSILNHITNINSTNKTDIGFKMTTMRRGMDYAKRNYGMFFSFLGNGNKALDNATKPENLKLSNFIMTHNGYSNNYPIWFFDTKEELENFIAYLKLKSVRFLLSLIKHNPELNTTKPCRIIPWMDFTKHYSEEDMKKYLGIDEELWDYIDKFIPDYYEDYRTKCRGDIK